MYINPYWAGVLTVVGVELLVCVALVVAAGIRNGRRK